MSDYEHLTVDSCVEYIRSTSELRDLVDVDAISTIEEVGDGNLNLVFIVKDVHGQGVVLKQALPYVRLVGPEWPMTPDRARLEAEATEAHSTLAPSAVPVLYHFNPERFIIAMEDLSDHVVWRTALNQGRTDEGVAAALGDYVARIAFGTSIFSVDPEQQKRDMARAINPELCTITEDLVFTEPWVDAGRNSVLPDNDADVAAIASDDFMVSSMGLAKWIFMTHAEALIHGDLHSGSVMIKCDSSGNLASARAIDSEFAFFGPVAFDLGVLWANYFIAAARAHALGEDDRARWCLDLSGQTWEAFEGRLRTLWPERRDPRVFTDAFLETLIDRWRSQCWLFAAAEMTRRIIGLAKTSDIESLDGQIRVGAARNVLQMAQGTVRARESDTSSAAFAALGRAQLGL